MMSWGQILLGKSSEVVVVSTSMERDLEQDLPLDDSDLFRLIRGLFESADKLRGLGGVTSPLCFASPFGNPPCED